MNEQTKKELVDYLGEYVTPEKKEKIDIILALRTQHLTVALEDVFQPHNASAIVRSTECFGVQDIYCVQDKYRFKVNQGVARGSAYWMNIHSNPSIEDSFVQLKKNGYRIVATTPHAKALYISELPIDQKTALVFGTELTGISQFTTDNADAFVKIPMFGFTESYNVSVSVALCLYELTKRLRASDIDWQLTQAERIDTRLQWYRRIVRASDALEKKFIQERK
ncbi:MAG: RNA methyltransferase [Candidatus Dependentiae bacterium]